MQILWKHANHSRVSELQPAAQRTFALTSPLLCTQSLLNVLLGDGEGHRVTEGSAVCVCVCGVTFNISESVLERRRAKVPTALCVFATH